MSCSGSVQKPVKAHLGNTLFSTAKICTVTSCAREKPSWSTSPFSFHPLLPLMEHFCSSVPVFTLILPFVSLAFAASSSNAIKKKKEGFWWQSRSKDKAVLNGNMATKSSRKPCWATTLRVRQKVKPVMLLQHWWTICKCCHASDKCSHFLHFY